MNIICRVTGVTAVGAQGLPPDRCHVTVNGEGFGASWFVAIEEAPTVGDAYEVTVIRMVNLGERVPILTESA